MKPIAFLLGITAFICEAQSPVATDTMTLSLDRCIAIALDKNPTIRVANMEVERMDYSRKETLGQLLPTLSFDGQYGRTLAKQTMYMNMGAFGGGSNGESPDGSVEEAMPAERSASSNGIKVGLDNSYTVGFNLSMPLIAPQLWKSLKLSDTQILQSVEQARQSRLDLIDQVKNAYYTLLLAYDSQRVIQQSYDMALFTAKLYESQEALGAASRYDVLRTQVAVKNVEPDLTQATIAIRRATLQLQVLMGMPSTQPIAPDVTLGSYEKSMYEDALRINTDDLSANTDLRLLDIQARQLDQSLEVQKASWWPTLSLSANYNWTTMNDGMPFKSLRWNPYSTIGLQLSVPLFQGMQRVSRIRQSQVQVREMQFQRDNLVRSLNMQVQVAYDNIQLNIKQIASSAESVRQADTAHTIMQQSFEAGAASYLDLRDSELALTQSRLAYLQSIYNYLVARADIERLLGSADTSAPAIDTK